MSPIAERRTIRRRMKGVALGAGRWALEEPRRVLASPHAGPPRASRLAPFAPRPARCARNALNQIRCRVFLRIPDDARAPAVGGDGGALGHRLSGVVGAFRMDIRTQSRDQTGGKVPGEEDDNVYTPEPPGGRAAMVEGRPDNNRAVSPRPPPAFPT